MINFHTTRSPGQRHPFSLPSPDAPANCAAWACPVARAGKEQSIRIQSSGGLSEEQILSMVGGGEAKGQRLHGGNAKGHRMSQMGPEGLPNGDGPRLLRLIAC